MPSPETGVPQLTAAQALPLLLQGAVLLDVREMQEWEAGHSPRALHMPLGEVSARASSLDPSRGIVVICRSGRRSDLVAGALRSAGYDAYNLSGGMQSWQQAGEPVVTDDGRPGTVI